MNAKQWESLVQAHLDDVLDMLRVAKDAGIVEPAVLIIDPREGKAREFCLANLPANQTAADIDAAIATAGVGDRLIVRLVKPRAALNAVLPPALQIKACDESHSFWVVCLEASKVHAVLMSKVLPSFN